MKNDFTIKIDGSFWMVRFVEFPEEPDKLGMCDFENKCIFINPNQSSIDVCYTLAHEILHASVPDLVEEAVLRYENALKSAKIFQRK